MYKSVSLNIGHVLDATKQLRLWSDSPRKAPTLQQYWIDVRGSGYGEWRDVPVVIQPHQVTEPL